MLGRGNRSACLFIHMWIVKMYDICLAHPQDDAAPLYAHANLYVLYAPGKGGACLYGQSSANQHDLLTSLLGFDVHIVRTLEQ
jgi:hypothetical protein